MILCAKIIYIDVVLLIRVGKVCFVLRIKADTTANVYIVDCLWNKGS